MPKAPYTFRSDMTVELIDSMASDLSVVRAARVSTIGAKSVDTDESVGLINYLMKNSHGSPFEHSAFTFLIECPILVLREYHRHRAGWSYNEMSGRYSQLEPVFYIPADDRLLVQEGKPGHYNFVAGTEHQHKYTVDKLKQSYTDSYRTYLDLLASGVAREVARASLPVATYSTMYATCNARSLMHFLGLRTHREEATFVSHPQREIEMVAEMLEHHFEALMPITYAAFNNNGRVSP